MKIGFAMCGSFCTMKTALNTMRELARDGHTLLPIMSYNAARLDTRFGRASDIKNAVRLIAGADIIETIVDAEPIGPNGLCDVVLIAPCTGNTLAKLACGITDTPVTMAAKSQLRTGGAVLIALSSNDALSANFKNLAELYNRKNVYFVPLVRDDAVRKPSSLVADYTRISECLGLAARGRQAVM